jgi:hypothetical protein
MSAKDRRGPKKTRRTADQRAAFRREKAKRPKTPVRPPWLSPEDHEQLLALRERLDQNDHDDNGG